MPDTNALSKLRYLQTLVEIAAEKYSSTVSPISIHTSAPFPNGLIQKYMWHLGPLPYSHTYTSAARLPHRLSAVLIKEL